LVDGVLVGTRPRYTHAYCTAFGVCSAERSLIDLDPVAWMSGSSSGVRLAEKAEKKKNIG
jgi:hypothetical protein